MEDPLKHHLDMEPDISGLFCLYMGFLAWFTPKSEFLELFEPRGTFSSSFTQLFGYVFEDCSSLNWVYQYVGVFPDFLGIFLRPRQSGC